MRAIFIFVTRQNLLNSYLTSEMLQGSKSNPRNKKPAYYIEILENAKKNRFLVFSPLSDEETSHKNY
jgi:hypothetical protein